ncbi:MAG: VPLPA-CTERM-specific exosortase XrtD [Pseudomonadota bacterium]
MNPFKQITIKTPGWITTLAYACIISLVYHTALTQMVLHDWAREDYTHCWLIPMIVLYMIWEKRFQLAASPSRPGVAGFVLFLPGIGLYWIGELGGEFYTMYLSLWLVVVGLSWIHLGWKKVRAIGIAFIAMLAMFPFPNFINVRISLFLQLVSSKLGVWMLRLFGMSAYREGNVIDLGFTQLQVVEACSGLRYVMPMMILSLILAYWFRAQLWKRVFLFLSSIPLAIFMNSFRIAATGGLHSYFGPKVADDFFHGFSGWILFVVAIPVLYLEMRILGSDDSLASRPPMETPVPPRDRRPVFSRVPAVTFLSMAILLLTAVLSSGVEFRERVPIKKSFSEFPLALDGWTGTRQSMEEPLIRALHFSDYLMAGYRNPEGREVDLYIAYYETQRKGQTTHSPETCLPGSGWSFEQAGLAVIPAGGGKSITVNRTFLEKSGAKQVTYFWFPQRGRILTSLFQVKLYSFWDALTRQRTDGALVRLITPVYPGEELGVAEGRLKGFAGEMVGVLSGFLPS